jgi:hypothetical protein
MFLPAGFQILPNASTSYRLSPPEKNGFFSDIIERTFIFSKAA